MARIVRPVREVYNRKGYILVIAYALAPWLFLMAAWATESILPLEEFVKFLIACRSHGYSGIYPDFVGKLESI